MSVMTQLHHLSFWYFRLDWHRIGHKWSFQTIVLLLFDSKNLPPRCSWKPADGLFPLFPFFWTSYCFYNTNFALWPFAPIFFVQIVSKGMDPSAKIALISSLQIIEALSSIPLDVSSLIFIFSVSFLSFCLIFFLYLWSSQTAYVRWFGRARICRPYR